MLKLRQILSNLRASFWFLPSLIVLVSTILSIALIEADTAGSDRWRVVDRAIYDVLNSRLYGFVEPQLSA